MKKMSLQDDDVMAAARDKVLEHLDQIEFAVLERNVEISIIIWVPAAIRDDKVSLWASEGLLTDLGNQRIIPQSLESAVGNGGTLYTFGATDHPTSVQFALEPSTTGVCNLALGVREHELLHMNVFVMP